MIYFAIYQVPLKKQKASSSRISTWSNESQSTKAFHEKSASISVFYTNGVPLGNDEIPIPATNDRLPAFDEQSLFPTVLHYSSLTLANEITVYNAILLLFLRLGSQIIGPIFNTSILSFDLPVDLNYGPLLPPGLAPSAQAVATEVCRSVEYHLQDVQSSAGAFFLLFPLKVAYLAFDPASREACWLKVVMSNIADMSGFEISRNLTENNIVLTSA